jgi:hypothetical protein
MYTMKQKEGKGRCEEHKNTNTKQINNSQRSSKTIHPHKILHIKEQKE